LPRLTRTGSSLRSHGFLENKNKDMIRHDQVKLGFTKKSEVGTNTEKKKSVARVANHGPKGNQLRYDAHFDQCCLHAKVFIIIYKTFYEADFDRLEVFRQVLGAITKTNSLTEVREMKHPIVIPKTTA